MLGLLTAVLTSSVVAAIAMPAQALVTSDNLACTLGPDLVTNCGFEAAPTGGVIPGWTHLVAHNGFLGSSSDPHHNGTHALGFAATSQDDVYTQTVKVAPHTKYLVAAWVDAVTSSGSPANDFTLAATNINGSSDASTIYTGSNLGSGWTAVGGTVTTAGGSTMTIVLRGMNVPNATYVDDVRVLPQRTGCAPIANNRVDNCGFENATVDPWVLTQAASGSDTNIATANANGGGKSLRLAATGALDDSWSQTLAVRPHTQYTLTYWTEYDSTLSPVNDLTVSLTNVPAASSGTLKVHTANVATKYWAATTKVFTTGNGSTAKLTVAGRNVPGQTLVDDVSVTAVPHVKITHSGRVATVTLNGVGGQKVYLEKLVGSHWTIVHTWTAPKTGYTKSWALTVGSAGAYRAVAAAAPGYGSTASGAIAIK